ncbi:hypothetical protein E3O44_00280 [Cryobacterium algoricola]|uniref:Lipopolysaccharide biosynthesis protein n=1 Tax=Cryobacterium algoricola TaxID=1259183 RepID=A0ABY2IL35_9MICO|nr:oligosaccharide flippase family protein [Cryobacterium algoricola]TFB91268.1 hypothetical protein E3O44_00280 [Cryobacterium algoricola]
MASTLIKSTGLATTGTLVQGLARFGYTILVGRLLGAETLGQVSGLIALSVFVSLFWPTATGVAASRFLAGPDGSAQSAVPILVREFLVSLPFLAIGTFFAAWMIVPDAAVAITTVALMVSFSSYAFSRGAALGQSRFLRVAIVDTVTSILTIALLLAVVLSQVSWLLLLPLTTGYAIFAMLCWPRGGRPSRTPDREITRFIFFNSLAQLAAGGSLQLVMIIARIYDTPTNSGLFAAAFSLATPASMLALSVNQVLIPHYSRQIIASPELHHRSNRRITLWGIAGFAVLFTLLAALSPVLIGLFYGPRFAGATPYMQWLLLGVAAYSVSMVPAASLIARGRDRRYAAAAALGFLATAVIAISLGSTYGAWAAVAAYDIGTLLSASAIVAMGLGRPIRHAGGLGRNSPGKLSK